jgi:hypothetical protein
MPDMHIPQELFEEAKADPFIGNRLGVPKGHKPVVFLNDKHEVVGFQLPGVSQRFNKPMTGSVYIAKKHRGNGYGTEVLANFLREHPEGVSYVNKKNEASRAAHAKAGWEDTGRREKGHRGATVWMKKKKEANMTKQASTIADRVLAKIGSLTTSTSSAVSKSNITGKSLGNVQPPKPLAKVHPGAIASGQAPVQPEQQQGFEVTSAHKTASQIAAIVLRKLSSPTS